MNQFLEKWQPIIIHADNSKVYYRNAKRHPTSTVAVSALAMGPRAAGFVIYRIFHSQVEYLLLQTSYGNHHWTPPKGHVDPGESDIDTAFRETEEESGLKKCDLKLQEGFQGTLKYDVKGSPKTVIYWLAEIAHEGVKVKLSEEHQDYKWVPLEEACKLSGYSDMIDLLNKCESFIITKNKV